MTPRSDGVSSETSGSDVLAGLLAAVPHVVVEQDRIVEVSPSVEDELGCDAAPLLGPLEAIGTRLDDATFDELRSGEAAVRVRLTPALADRPVRLRRLGGGRGRVWIEVRSLADEYRMESLLRRSGIGHMLISPKVEVQWSMTSNELTEVFPGDDPMNWVELMDPDDMQAMGKAIAAVGADPSLRKTVRHRLKGDRTYTVVDTIESAMHDPDLRAVLMRSRLEGAVLDESRAGADPSAGVTVSDHMPIGVIVASRAGKVLHRNAVAAELVGARVGQLVVPDGDEPWLLSRLAPDESASMQAVFASASAGTPAHCTISSPFDSRRWLRLSVSPAAAATVVLTIEDTTELVTTERALRASNRLLEALDSHSEDLVTVFDARGRARYTSSSVRRLLGEDARLDHIDDLAASVHPQDRAAVADVVRRVRSAPSGSEQIEFRVNVGADDEARWHHATMTNLLDDPDVQGLVFTVRDVHERYLAERELRFKATHDALTALPDRASLLARLDVVLQDAQRDGHQTALIFCDVDNFKLINDRAGHRVGDLVLIEVADRLRSALRLSDFVGRFGGDEFVVVAPAVDNEEHAMALAARVFSVVTGPARCGEIDVDVSVSMGLAVSDADTSDAADLLHHADLAMYESKNAGRGRLTLSSRPSETDDRADGLRRDLRHAVESRQLTVHYQRIVPLRDGLVAGWEALARWDHPQHGPIDARRFLGVAEVAGFAGELGDELIRVVCEDQHAIFASDPGFVAINVSLAQIAVEGAAEAVLSRLETGGVDSRSVVVELTEGAFEQGDAVAANLVRLRQAGVRLFLDDFGVGYASLSHLHRFPVDGIKIDSSIVNPVVDENLVRLIVGVATTLDLRTVAEGVETTDQLDAVSRLGVDYAQGFLLARPTRHPEVPSTP